MKIAVFVYDFPHRKSFEFLTRLWLDGHDVQLVLGAPFRPMTPVHEIQRVKPRRSPAPHPADVAARMGVEYAEVDHASEEAIAKLRGASIDVGIIGGARILPEEVIAAVGLGILNFHPGLLPQVRGLDALRWTVYEGAQPGITVHLIDSRVDAGRIVLRRAIPVHPDDDWVDLSLRLDDAQVDAITPALSRLAAGPRPTDYQEIGDGPLRTSMDPKLQRETLLRFDDWKRGFAIKAET